MGPLKTETEMNRSTVAGTPRRRILKLSRFYDLQRRTLMVQLIRASPLDPIRAITLEEQCLVQIDYGIKRVGGPRNTWWEKGVTEYWDFVKLELAPELQYSTFNKDNVLHVNALVNAAAEGRGTRLRELTP